MTNVPSGLQDDLRTAMAIELTTIPAYLYPYWSIKSLDDGGTQAGVEAARTIMSVVLEEMLHMSLVSNVLNALGGTPALTTPPYPPHYPGPLLRHAKGISSFEVLLAPLSLDAIDLFLKIELPEYDDPGPPITHDWKTLGEFYEGIEAELTDSLDYSSGRQLPTIDNPGVGTLIQVSNQQEALQALELIVEQGEGLSKKKHDDGEHELSHYWKFMSIKDDIDNGTLDLSQTVYPVVMSPDPSTYNTEQQAANNTFNKVYGELLDLLQTTLSSDSPNIFAGATNLMDQMAQLAAVLRQTGPISGTNTLPGPTFTYPSD